jgi:hypothetical protein
MGNFELYELDALGGHLRQIRRVEKFGFLPELGLENSLTRVLTVGASKIVLYSVQKVGFPDNPCEETNFGCLREVMVSYDIATESSSEILNLSSELREGVCRVLFDQYGATVGFSSVAGTKEPPPMSCTFVASDISLDAQLPLGDFFPVSNVVHWVDPYNFRIAIRHLAAPVILQRSQRRLGLYSPHRPNMPPLEIKCASISAPRCQRVEGIKTSRANVLIDNADSVKLYRLEGN